MDGYALQIIFHYVGYNEAGRKIDSTYIQGSLQKFNWGMEHWFQENMHVLSSEHTTPRSPVSLLQPADNCQKLTENLPENVTSDPLPSTSSIPDPADWDPNYSDESLLQEDHSLSVELNSLHLRETSGQTNRSSRLAPIQSHDISSSNPSALNQRSVHLFHASSTHPPGHATLNGYNHANYSQQSLPSFRGQQFQQYNNMTSSYIRPMRTHHNGQPAWANYSLAEPPPTTTGDRMSWGGRAGHSFAASGLSPSVARKDFGRIF